MQPRQHFSVREFGCATHFWILSLRSVEFVHTERGRTSTENEHNQHSVNKTMCRCLSQLHEIASPLPHASYFDKHERNFVAFVYKFKLLSNAFSLIFLQSTFDEFQINRRARTRFVNHQLHGSNNNIIALA